MVCGEGGVQSAGSCVLGTLDMLGSKFLSILILMGIWLGIFLTVSRMKREAFLGVVVGEVVAFKVPFGKLKLFMLAVTFTMWFNRRLST